MTSENKAIPNLPDEKDYPAELVKQCELLECFSATGDAETLLARDRSNGALYVVKCYRQNSPLFDRAEPQALKNLNAKPLPQFIAEYGNELMRCVLREYVEGETLAELAASRRLSEDEIIAIGAQLCDELSELHAQTPPVIHRDIKPQNVVIRPDGVAVLIDFGISRVYSENETDTIAFGTQGFAPPEQYGYAQTDARSDIYSLGVLLQWLLHGEAAPPKEADTPLEKVIRRCTTFDPKGRYTDTAQVKKALIQTTPASRRKRGAAYAIAAVCAVLAVVFGISAVVGRNTKSVAFSQPLIEQAVRLNLGLSDSETLTEELLSQVTAVYIVADTAYPDQDAFYPAINQWYADGQPVRGGITTLEDLVLLPNLEQACIVAQELEDISAVSELKMMNKVEFKHNYITDISALAGLDRLTSVGINDNPVRDISPLADCPNLAFLDLCDVRTYDASVIARLGNFDYLDLSNPTDSYNYLAGKSVLALRLAWTGLNSLDVLNEVTRLEDLDIAHTDAADLSPLSRHTGLTTLNIAALPVSDLSVLVELPQLENVTVSEDMRPLAEALGEVSFTFRYE